ncbi:hypothetical protein BH20ACI2_BH20ACI2_08680 [soil metagenome]
MKKCPACEKTFEDSMRFCQVDGTPLVDDVPFDPFATIVGVTAPVPEPDVKTSEPFVPQPEEAEAITEPDDLLDLQDADPLKTMYASDDEMKAALRPDDIMPEPGIFEVPPIEDTSSAESAWSASEPAATESEPPPSVPEPELPSFNVPDVPAPSFGDISPPPSPFSSGNSTDTPMPVPTFDEPLTESRSFNEAETIIQGGFTNPFENPPQTPVEEWAPPPDPVEEWTPPPAPVEEWTPPPAPEASWENQHIGSNTPFQPPVADGASGQNKTLPIVSLVLGILSLCCYVSPVTGLAALVTGFIGIKNANNSPDVYGGKGLAIAGMVLGGLLLLLGLAYWIFLLFFGGMAMIMDAAR